ncbi:hypothetical protein LR48_Vigan04g185700 [Vigna angularis]|uniref:Uncharacterized protein n=1 Tax=Phaseolus angularis TaxID=3914 RepID=A0A0L9UGH5_PHAAN|nr:hypothetical protein LR48_Vigan04g185700 [Vigna angularis]
MLLMAWMEERRIHSLHGRVELDKGNLTVQQLGIETTATTFTVFILAAAATITSSWEKKEVLCNMRTPGCILSSATSSLHHHPPSSTFLTFMPVCEEEEQPAGHPLCIVQAPASSTFLSFMRLFQLQEQKFCTAGNRLLSA